MASNPNPDVVVDGRTTRTDGEVTRNRILDVADELFAEHGYSGASMRAIAEAAGVNLSAANYHFGSKRGLLTAAIHRHTVPINEVREARLDELLARDGSPEVRDIMRAFFAPLLNPELTGRLPKIIARQFVEPEFARPLLEREFAPTVARFMAALSQALPHVAPDELAWRLHFVLGSMLHILSFHTPLAMPGEQFDVDTTVERLVEFAARGLGEGEGGAA